MGSFLGLDLYPCKEKAEVIDSDEIQFLGSKDEFIEMINTNAEKFKKPAFIIIKSKLYVVELEIPLIEIPRVPGDLLKRYVDHQGVVMSKK